MPQPVESILELQKTAKNFRLFVSIFILAIHNNGLGLSFYYASVSLPYHKDGTFEYIKMSEDEDTWYVSFHQLTMLLGSVVSHPLGESLGRKKVLIGSNVLTIVSFVIMYFGFNYPLLLTGRLISGFAVGLGALIPFVLISEIATIKYRSGMANTCNLFCNIGELMLHFIDMGLYPPYLHFVVIASSVLCLGASIFLTESPHWLIRVGRQKEAEQVFRILRGEEYAGIHAEIQDVIAVIQPKSKNNALVRWFSPSFLKPLGILFVLFSTIGLCGIDAPLDLYGPRMFAEFGFQISYRFIVLIIPAGTVLGYILATPLLGCMSKKYQYIGSALLMAVSAGLLSLAYYFKEENSCSILAQGLLAAGALGFTFGYGAGLGSVTYVLPGELLSPDELTLGISAAECFRVLWTAAFLKVYPFYLALVGYTYMLIFHAAVLILTAVFVFLVLPDTRNKTLSELQGIFKEDLRLKKKSIEKLS